MTVGGLDSARVGDQQSDVAFPGEVGQVGQRGVEVQERDEVDVGIQVPSMTRRSDSRGSNLPMRRSDCPRTDGLIDSRPDNQRMSTRRSQTITREISFLPIGVRLSHLRATAMTLAPRACSVMRQGHVRAA